MPAKSSCSARCAATLRPAIASTFAATARSPATLWPPASPSKTAHFSKAELTFARPVKRRTGRKLKHRPLRKPPPQPEFRLYVGEIVAGALVVRECPFLFGLVVEEFWPDSLGGNISPLAARAAPQPEAVLQG